MPNFHDPGWEGPDDYWTPVDDEPKTDEEECAQAGRIAKRKAIDSGLREDQAIRAYKRAYSERWAQIARQEELNEIRGREGLEKVRHLQSLDPV